MVTPQYGQAEDAALPFQRSGGGFTVRDFLIATAFHIRIVVLVALIPIIVSIIAAVVTKTEYTASSLLLVIVSREVNPQGLTDTGPSVLTIEGLKQVESEVRILESAEVARATIEEIGMDTLFPPGPFGVFRPLFGGSDQDQMDKAVERFESRLSARVLSDSNVVEVSFANPNRQIAIKTTNALVRNYLASRKKVLENPTSQILTGEVDRFKTDLTSVDAEIEELKTKVRIIDFTQDAVLAANQRDSIVQRRRQVEEREIAVTGQLAEAENQLKALPESVFDFSEKADALAGDEDSNTLTKLMVERDRLAAQYAPTSPLLRDINIQIDTVRKRVATRGDHPFYTDRAVRNPGITYIQNMILSLRVELDSLRLQKGELKAQEERADARLDALRIAETRLVELNRRRDALNEGYREYLRRAVAAKIEETAASSRDSNVRLIQPAGASVLKRSLTLPLLAAGLVGGLLFGAAAGAISSALRTTFIMPTEAERSLELPALAELDEGAEEPLHAGVEQTIGACATLLLDTTVDDKHVQALHFLSSETDDTLPWFCGRLAEEFALQRQKRTLLVDLCSKTPYPLYSGTPQVKGGLAVTSTPVPLLWSAADVATSPLLSVRLPVVEGERMLQKLKQEFDCIIICSNLTGSSLITQRLSQLVDGNVICVHAEKTRKLSALHLRELVQESNGALLGLIFFGRRYYLPQWLYRRA